jgi:CRP-like cAMP-binding protein
MKANADEILKTLKKCAIFEGLFDEELNAVVGLSTLETYDAGETIYEQGSLGTHLYVLSQGQVSLYRRLKLDDSREVCKSVYVLRETPARRMIGGWCTLAGKEHVQMCLARCDKKSRVVSIGCRELKAIIDNDLNMRIKVLERLVLILRDRLESSYAAMETL